MTPVAPFLADPRGRGAARASPADQRLPRRAWLVAARRGLATAVLWDPVGRASVGAFGWPGLVFAVRRVLLVAVVACIASPRSAPRATLARACAWPAPCSASSSPSSPWCSPCPSRPGTSRTSPGSRPGSDAVQRPRSIGALPASRSFAPVYPPHAVVHLLLTLFPAVLFILRGRVRTELRDARRRSTGSRCSCMASAPSRSGLLANRVRPLHLLARLDYGRGGAGRLPSPPRPARCGSRPALSALGPRARSITPRPSR